MEARECRFEVRVYIGKNPLKKDSTKKAPHLTEKLKEGLSYMCIAY
jgi:hypothetical protein